MLQNSLVIIVHKVLILSPFKFQTSSFFYYIFNNPHIIVSKFFIPSYLILIILKTDDRNIPLENNSLAQVIYIISSIIDVYSFTQMPTCEKKVKLYNDILISKMK